MLNFTSESNQIKITVSHNVMPIIRYIRLFILIVGFLGNIFAIFILSCSNSIRKSRIYILLVNQCLLNLVCTTYFLFLFPYNAMHVVKIRTMSGNWDWILCTFVRSHSLPITSSCCSNYNLAASSLERCTSILYPIYHRNVFTRINVKRLCYLIWLLGFIIILPHAILLNDISIHGLCNYWKSSSKGKTYIFESSLYIFYFIIPLFIIIVSFASLYNRIVIRKLKAKLNIIKMLFSCSVLYLLLQGQRTCLRFIELHYDLRESSEIISISLLLIYTTYSINPMVYIIQYAEFKNEISRQFYKLRSKRVADITTNSKHNTSKPSLENALARFNAPTIFS